MLAKTKERDKAILLRKQGKSYSEICSLIPVSQSSLSFWLRNIELTPQQIDQLSLKKKKGQSKGGLAKRIFRENQQQAILKESADEIKDLSKKELWLLGIVAYWCEGAKQKENNISQAVVFANSDATLIKLFIKWLKEICKVINDDIIYSLYIHDNADVAKALAYWSETLEISKYKFGEPILKKHNIATKRRNIHDNYHGLIRISVRKSTNLNRKISGWILGIGKNIN